MTMAASTVKRTYQQYIHTAEDPPAKRTCLENSSPTAQVDTKSIKSHASIAEQLGNHQTNHDYHLSDISADHEHLVESKPVNHHSPLEAKSEQIAGEAETQNIQKRERISDWISQSLNPDGPDTELLPFEDPFSLHTGIYHQDSRNMPTLKRVPSQDLPLPNASFYGSESQETSGDTISNFYTNPAIETIFEQIGISLENNPNEINGEDMTFCEELLSTSAQHPLHAPLEDEHFRAFVRLSRKKSEAWLTNNLLPFIFPAPELLSAKGVKTCQGLISGCNDAWIRAIYLWRRPQPDCTVAFRWENFSDEERRKLGVVPGVPSPYVARDEMYFPFFTREAKKATGSMEVARRQNAHSMGTIADGYVNLFRRASRLNDLSGKVFGLSMAHDTNTIDINAHYVVISNHETKQTVKKCQALVKTFDLDDKESKNWRAPLQFLYNMYKNFSERQLKRIKETIALLDDPGNQPSPSIATAVEGLQTGEQFKKPRNSNNADLRKQVDVLITQLDKQGRNAEKERENAQKARENTEKREKELLAEIKSQRENAQKREENLLAEMKMQREETKMQREEAKMEREGFMKQISMLTLATKQHGNHPTSSPLERPP